MFENTQLTPSRRPIDGRRAMDTTRSRCLWVAAIILIFCGTLPLMGQSKPQADTQKPQADNQETHIVAAETFVLQDAQGRQRGEFSIKEGMPSLSLLDENGVCRVRLGMCPDGSPEIAVFDAKGRDRALFHIALEGEPGLVLDRGADGRAERAAADPAIVADDGGQESPSIAAAEPARSSPAATAMFGQHCARCHGEDGSGAGARSELPRLPDFRAAAWQASRSDARLLASIVNGRGADMPPFRGEVTDTQARALLALIRGFGPVRRAAADLSNGDFSSRFQALEREFDELQQRLQKLQAASARP
jgi:mono/diheme cytochrome c family protein